MVRPDQKAAMAGSETPDKSAVVVRLPVSSPEEKMVRYTTPPRSEYVQYDSEDLRLIGRLCGNRLPPASSVQAMFLYEMQRETEQERLFQGQMFQLARAQDTIKSQQDHMTALEQKIMKFQHQTQSREIDERLAAGRVRMDAHQAKIDEQSKAINSMIRDLGNASRRLEEHDTESKFYHKLVDSHTSSLKAQEFSIKDAEAKVKALQTARDSLDAQLATFNAKIWQLEQNHTAALDVFKIQHDNINAAHHDLQSVKSSFEASEAKKVKNINFATYNIKAHLGEIEASLYSLQEQVSALVEESKAMKTAHDDLSADVQEAKVATATTTITVNALNSDIGVLFEERDALIASLGAARTRIDKLEGTVRALTGQNATSPLTSTATSSPQMLPVRGPSGKTVDLAVPKGGSLVEYRRAEGGKENSKPDHIRPFVPGTPWQQEEEEEEEEKKKNKKKKKKADRSVVDAGEPVVVKTAEGTPRSGLFSFYDE